MAMPEADLELLERCWAIAEFSPTPTAVTDGNLLIRYVNPAFCHLACETADQLTGQPVSRLMPAEDDLLALLQQVSLTGRAVVHAGHEHPATRRMSWSYVLWPVMDAERRCAAVMIQVTASEPLLLQATSMNEALLIGSVQQHELTEVAEQRNLELGAEIEHRNQIQLELTRSNEDLEQFARVTSHDLQEPLRAMLQYSQLLKKRYKGQFDSDADLFLDYVASGAERMRDLIHALLSYSRLTQPGVLPFVMAPLESALHFATLNLELAIEDSAAVLTHGDLPAVSADQAQIVQLFQNLIGNAIKFRQPGTAPRIHISAVVVSSEWVISVRDNGMGIPAEYTERIFEVFKRLHGREIAGTGMGLAIAKRIVLNHGGRIWATSEAGQGSTISFTLPL